jgi:hypothetical protein
VKTRKNKFKVDINILKTALLCVIVLVSALTLVLFRNIFPINTALQNFDSAAAATTFLETFDGFPAAPQQFTQIGQSRWDVAIHSRDGYWASPNTWNTLETMDAHHGADCSKPITDPAPGNPTLVTHRLTGTYEDYVFKCRDHVMTSMNASGYGLVALTPNNMIDFTNGEAVLKFDMSTLRSSGRDWVDVWITPYQENIQLPFDQSNLGSVDLQGSPRNAIHINLNLARNEFEVNVVRNGNSQNVSSICQGCTYDSWLTQDAARRDTFQLNISRSHLKFGMPTYNKYWTDANIADLGWTQGVVQFAHHSYTPTKDCGTANKTGPDGTCKPNTWHWDNISIAPSQPFTMIKGDKRYALNGQTVTFQQPAPANSNLRFSGIGNIQVSFNGGSMQQARKQPSTDPGTPEHFTSYWMPIPQGTQTVKFQISSDSYVSSSELRAKDLAIWSKNQTSQPTPITQTNPPTPIATPTRTSTPSPTSIGTPISTPRPTATPIATQSTATSVIKIYAAGQFASGSWPILKLSILEDGVRTVRLTSTVDVNASSNQLKEITYVHPNKVKASQLRVHFTNDYYDRSTNLDRNLKVNRINVDGVDYLSSNSNTYSVGSWNATTGCAGGNKSSEWLMCRGYFDFSNTSPSGIQATATPRASITSTPTPRATSVPSRSPSPSTTSGGGTTYFKTSAVGSTLPTDAYCASAIKRRAENKQMNATYNATRGNQVLSSNFLSGDPRANTEIAARVTGNFTGTTDEILQWTACKWGIDEDIVRAQAATESYWQQTAKGDWTTDSSRCAPGHGLGVDGRAGQCPESFGILQNRYPYEKSGWPSYYNSTAFNSDTAYGIWRACYEGYEWWLNDVDRGQTYVSGDAWGCIGRWFAGRWHTQAANDYVTRVKENLTNRIWEQPSFQE